MARVESPSTARTRWALAVLAAAALAVRLAAVLVLRSDLLRDTSYEHGVIARSILEGSGFRGPFLGSEGPTSQQAPFYPYLLAAMGWLVGSPSSAMLLATQLVQAAAGAALAVVLVWLGWLLVPERRGVGWLAGIGAAVYPIHVYAVTHIQVAVWAALGLVVLLALAVRAGQAQSALPAAAAGLSAGLLVLIDPILTLAVPVAGLCLWHHSPALPCDGADVRSIRERVARKLARLGAFGGCASLVVIPWLVRNAQVHGEFVFVKSTFGYAFWQGNNPVSWGTDKVP
ncbi:MAG: hypothetical protein ACOC46_03400, partial [Pirellulales bacterium]